MNDAAFTASASADPTARSRVYRLLADVFRYPDAELFEELRGGEYFRYLAALLDGLPHARLSPEEKAQTAERFQDELASIEFADYESRYIMTFDVGAPRPPCPPYEGTYRDGVPRQKRLLAIATFYKHFGLKMNEAEGQRELPDHIAAEFEFMHFLTFKEAQARGASKGELDEDLLRGYVLAQRDFLARHLTLWLPKFAERLTAVGKCAAFGLLANLGTGFIDRELGFVRDQLKAWGMGEEVELPEDDESPAPPMPGDGGGCPLAGDGQNAAS